LAVTDWSSLELADAAALSTEDVLGRLQSTTAGLSQEQALARLAEVGTNALRSHGARPLAVLARQLRNPLLILLVAAALTSFTVGERTSALIILLIICLSLGLGFFNEYRSELAVEALHSKLRHTALVIRDLRTQAVHAIPFAPPVTAGTPPEWITNWSPDGTQIALVSGEKTMLVEPATAATVGSQAPIAGSAPAFLNENALVVLANCCIGRQLLDTVDLQTGVRTPFAHLSSPTEFIRRVAPGRFLILTALRELVIVERGRTRVIARGLSSAGV